MDEAEAQQQQNTWQSENRSESNNSLQQTSQPSLCPVVPPLNLNDVSVADANILSHRLDQNEEEAARIAQVATRTLKQKQQLLRTIQTERVERIRLNERAHRLVHRFTEYRDTSDCQSNLSNYFPMSANLPRKPTSSVPALVPFENRTNTTEMSQQHQQNLLNGPPYALEQIRLSQGYYSAGSHAPHKQYMLSTDQTTPTRISPNVLLSAVRTPVVGQGSRSVDGYAATPSTHPQPVAYTRPQCYSRFTSNIPELQYIIFNTCF